jgi:predicted nuclease of restriction endonuclease-like RecB superfamily
MLTRAAVRPFVVADGERLTLRYLRDRDGRVAAFADRLCRLARKLEGWPRHAVEEALRRQERRVRDVARLAGLAQTLLQASRFEPPAGAGECAARRAAVFAARARRWPPIPGDMLRPYEDVAGAGESAHTLFTGFYDDRPAAWQLVKAPAWSGAQLLAQYHLELGRAVLRDALQVEIRVRGGWRAVFASVKLARLMYDVRRVGRGYRLSLTGPASAFLARPARYGARFSRIVPAVSRASAWQIEAEVLYDGNPRRFSLRGQARGRVDRHGGGAERVRIGPEPTRARFDSAWERHFVREFRAARAGLTAGWTIARERSPLFLDGRLALPDFTLRHSDGREALVELVGFWTPDYLRAKAEQVARAGVRPLVLVVAKALAMGTHADALVAAAGDRLVWCTERPRMSDVMRVVERVAREGHARRDA